MLSKMKNGLELCWIIYHLLKLLTFGILSCQCHVFLTKQHIISILHMSEVGAELKCNRIFLICIDLLSVRVGQGSINKITNTRTSHLISQTIPSNTTHTDYSSSISCGIRLFHLVFVSACVRV